MRKVEVVAYKDSWVLEFAEEAHKLREIFGSAMIDIHHIGSTSIPGISAKPIIDIMPVVEDINVIELYNSAMSAIGYHPKGENGIAGRRYFEKGGEQRTHHVHCFQSGNPHIQRHLAFRDYLAAHQDLAATYAALKAELAEQHPYDIEAYIQGKERLVAEIERKALIWYQNRKEQHTR